MSEEEKQDAPQEEAEEKTEEQTEEQPEEQAEEPVKKKVIIKEENIDYKDAYIRAQADYQNLIKENEKKKTEWIEFANLGLLTDLIPVLEHFHQGMKYVPQNQRKENWFVGFQQIKKQLDEFMIGNHLERMETIGRMFDPALHDAVGKRKEEDKDTDMILEEVMGGYTLHGKVVQPAKVIVAE